MKKIILSVSVLAMLLVACSKDDATSESPSGNKDLANVQNAAEETEIPLSMLETGISIDGAQKITGAAPQVNSNLQFVLESNQQEAFQDSGLDIKFKATGAVAGAYIQFKDVNGNTSDSYFDVPVSAFGSDDFGQKILNTHRSTKFISQTIDLEQDSVINIGFDNIPAGQFCYDICLYDVDQNVFVVQEACVEVESWGGNASIAGSWIFESSQGASSEFNSSLITCDSGDTVVDNSNFIDSLDEWVFVLNEDGTYYETTKGTSQVLDFSTTVETCVLTYFPTGGEYFDKFSGNWAYNEENETLTVIDFSSEDFLFDSKESFPEGELYFEGIVAEVVGGKLRLEGEDGEIFVFTRM